MQKRQGNLIVYANACLAVGLAAYFLFAPGVIVVANLCDPAIRDGGIPKSAWRLHKRLAGRYGAWARERIASGKAHQVHYLNVPGTEWPVFGSVFFLMATERLQDAWEADPTLSREAPAVYARDTVEACKELLLDPGHHAWVKTHWGDDYMHRENVFFRSLLIAGLTSYERLTESGETLALLRDQADTLAEELNASPYGVLHDYPGECYPIDVLAAVAWIRRSDTVTGADHSAFVEREKRAFQGNRLDARGLIPWDVDPWTGQQFRPSRGIVNAHVLIFAPGVYPEAAKEWYAAFEEHFWQEKWYAKGWREFYRDRPDSEWTYDVDAGPIIGGFSPSANAFGVAAARANGRMDHAYTLTAQMLTAFWPLPDGRLWGPRFLSDPENAPYLGETALLWFLTQPVPVGVEQVHGGKLAGSVYLGLAFYFGGTLLVLLAVFLRIRKWIRGKRVVPGCRVQTGLWITLLAGAVVLLSLRQYGFGTIALLASQIFPIGRKGRSATSESAATTSLPSSDEAPT